MSSDPANEPRISRLRRPPPRSLRARLVAAMVVLPALAFLVVGVTTEVTLNKVLYGRVDDQLTAAAGRAPRAFESSAPFGNVRGEPDCMQPRDRGFPPGQIIGTLAARTCRGIVVNSDVLVERGQPQPDVSAL